MIFVISLCFLLVFSLPRFSEILQQIPRPFPLSPIYFFLFFSLFSSLFSSVFCPVFFSLRKTISVLSFFSRTYPSVLCFSFLFLFSPPCDSVCCKFIGGRGAPHAHCMGLQPLPLHLQMAEGCSTVFLHCLGAGTCKFGGSCNLIL